MTVVPITLPAITKSCCDSMDYDINPYSGCSHGCIYCYAGFMKEATGHKEPWGAFVDVLYNEKLLKGDAAKYAGKNILLSSLTDPYLQLEAKKEATRSLLRRLICLKPNLWILTKSDLVLRDVDILKKFGNCRVGFSLATLDERVREEIEPYASSIERRLKALQKLKNEGIKTFVFIGPILPFITDWREIVLKTRRMADMYMFENLKIHGMIWESLRKWLWKKESKMLKDYERIYFTKNSYWREVEKAIKGFCDDARLDYRIYFHYGESLADSKRGRKPNRCGDWSHRISDVAPVHGTYSAKSC